MTYADPNTALLVSVLQKDYGLDPDTAAAAVRLNANPNAIVSAPEPELQAFLFPALAYAAHTALAPGCTQLKRLALLETLIDHGANRADAAGMLLAVYSDLWQTHPATARRMVIGMHTLHTAIEPYLSNPRTLPMQSAPPYAPAPLLSSKGDEIPF